eukprot:14531994-Heterocapsa_arctica.AAC.1
MMGSEMGVKSEGPEERPEEMEVAKGDLGTDFQDKCKKKVNVDYEFGPNGIEAIWWRKWCSTLLIMIACNRKLVAVMYITEHYNRYQCLKSNDLYAFDRHYAIPDDFRD